MGKPSKPTVLILVGHYLPGFKAGGILRSMENMVNHLHSDFHFKVLTRDRDLGDAQSYPHIGKEIWQSVGRACVKYLAPEVITATQLGRIINETPHDLLYLNSVFDALTVKTLVCRKMEMIAPRPIILAPRGEFAWASFRLKYAKKVCFLFGARLVGLYSSVLWHASSEHEAGDIMKVMKTRANAIRIALNMPTIRDSDRVANLTVADESRGQGIKIVFLSRISPEKNLDFALEVLTRVKFNLSFDIIGPIENLSYWKRCERIIQNMPNHVKVRTLGAIQPSEVTQTLSKYDLLFFPSGGENYGHVIAESLISGTQVLISTNTPWRNLEERGLGWDFPLDRVDAFVNTLDRICVLSGEERLARREVVRESMMLYLSESPAVEHNRQMLIDAIGTSKAEL